MTDLAFILIILGAMVALAVIMLAAEVGWYPFQGRGDDD